MNNEFDFKGYLKNNPLLKETNINININESKLRERVKTEILSALKENDAYEGIGEFDSNKPARIKEFIIALNSLVDEYHAELYLNDSVFDAISMVIKYAQEEAMNMNEAEEKDQPEEEETTPEVADVEPEITGDEKIVQDALTKAYEAANKIGDKKLLDQIGNTITFFTRSHIVSNK
jgi:hypothetical protein